MNRSGAHSGRARGCVLAAFTAFLTAIGHLAAGGAVPDLALLVVLLPAFAWPLVAVADSCRGALPAGAVVLSGQFALHQLMGLVHAHHVVQPPAVPDEGRMLVAHLAVTVLIVTAIRHADRGIAAFNAALGRVTRWFVAPPPAVPPAATVLPPDPDVPALRRGAVAAHRRRGPPRGVEQPPAPAPRHGVPACPRHAPSRGPSSSRPSP